MTEKSKDQDETAFARRSVITLRVGYIVSLVAIAVICTYFFIEQRDRNRMIQQIGEVSAEFAEVDHALRAIAERTKRIAQTYVNYQAFVDTRLDGATLMEKRKIRESMPVDPDIVSALSSLRFRFERARWKIKHLEGKWDALPGTLTQEIQAQSRYMTNEDPFLNHRMMLGAERLDTARTPSSPWRRERCCSDTCWLPSSSCWCLVWASSFPSTSSSAR